MTSVLNVDTIADKAGTGPVALTKQHAAKAWVNYTTAATFVNNGSFNVSSLTDVGAGSCKIVFTNVMNDDAFSTTGLQVMGAGQLGLNAQETNLTWCISYNTSNAAADSGETTGTVHGDLA